MGTQGVQFFSSSLEEFDELLEELDELLEELDELLEELDELLEEPVDDGKLGTPTDVSVSHATHTNVAQIKHININKNFFIFPPYPIRVCF